LLNKKRLALGRKEDFCCNPVAGYTSSGFGAASGDSREVAIVMNYPHRQRG